MASVNARFPDPQALAAKIEEQELEHNLRVSDAVAALGADHERIQGFETLEDLAAQAYEETGQQPEGAAARLADAMTRVRNAIADELWPRELFVAVEILDELLFEALRAKAEDPVFEVLRSLRDARVDATGLLVFGVHSIGLQGASLPDLLAGTGVEFGDPSWGVAITPQTNSLEDTIGFLDRAAKAFGVNGEIPQEMVEHWRRSRQAEWLERNPLIAVRVAEASGSYYGNEALLLTRLQAATVLVAMLASVQPGADPQRRSTLTTAVINNFETLDVHHYLVLSPGRSATTDAELGGDFVPISRLRSDLVDMSMLGMDLDPAYWSEHREEADRVAGAVGTVYRGYLRRGFDRSQDDAAARQSRRQFESTVFFQRSFTGSPWRDIITLSTAFELLLHGPSAGNTSKLIRGALKAISRGSERNRYLDAFDQVSKARNEIMHQGTQRTQVDLPGAREAYVRAFVQEVGADA
jgi:hypothetical protein